MGIFTYTDPQTNKTYNFEHGGAAPTEADYAYIADYLKGERANYAGEYKQVFGEDAPVADDGTALGRGFASGVQSAKGGLGELLQTTGNRLGFQGLEDYGTSMEQNAVKEAGLASLTNPAPLSYRDVKGLGTGLTYLGELAGSSAPAMGAGIVGAGAAALAAPAVGIGAGAAALLGAGAATLPIYAGENLQEQERVSGEGNVNLTKALGTGAFQAALDAASLKVLGRLGIGKAALVALEGGTGQKLTTRLLTGALQGTLAEGGTEAVQELATMWQGGGDLNSPEAQERLLSAFIGGGVLGGVAGGAGRGVFGKRPEIDAAPPAPELNDEATVDQVEADEAKAPVEPLTAEEPVEAPAVTPDEAPVIVPNTQVAVAQEEVDQTKAPAKEPVLKAGRRPKVTTPTVDEAPATPDTSGWKLHLNPAPGSEQAISDYLTEKGVPHKVGQASGQTGKGMTVYVGAKDAATTLASDLDTRFSTLLKDAEGDVLNDDTPLAGKVWGRFDIGGKDAEFHQYGKAGVPFFTDDMGQLGFAEDRDAAAEQARVRADKALTARYGEFYTGTAPANITPDVTADTAAEVAAAEELAAKAQEAADKAVAAQAAAAVKAKKTVPMRDKRKANEAVKAAADTAKAAQDAATKATKDADIARQKAEVKADTAAKRRAAANPAPRASTEDASAAPTTPSVDATTYNAVGQGQVTGLPEQNIPAPAVPRTFSAAPVVEPVVPIDDAAAVAALLATPPNQLNTATDKSAKNAHNYFSKSSDIDFMLDFIAADAAQPGTPQIRRASQGKALAPMWQGTGKTAATSAVEWIRANMSPKTVKKLNAYLLKYETDTSVATSDAVDARIISERERGSEENLAKDAKYYESLIPGSADKAAAARARNAAQVKKPTLALTRQAITAGLSEMLHPVVVQYLRNGQLSDALNALAVTSSDAYTRNMAYKLSTFVGNTKVYTTYNDGAMSQEILQSKDDPNVLDAGAYLLLTKEDFDSIAATDPEYAALIQDAIFLNEDGGLTAHVLLHEMAHAATVKEIKNNPNGPVAKRIDALRKQVLERSGVLTYTTGVHSYGLKDSREFAAEILSNTDFQQELDRVFPNDRKISAFRQGLQEIINFVRSRILGLAPKVLTQDSVFDEADFLVQSVLNVAPEFVNSTPLFSRAMQPARSKKALTDAGKLALEFTAADAVNTARAVQRSVSVTMPQKAMPAVLNLFTPVRNLVDLATPYFPTAMDVYASLSGQKSFEQKLNETNGNTMKQVNAYLRANPTKAAAFHSFRTRASRYEIDVRLPESFYNEYVLAYYPLNADGTPGKREYAGFDSFEDRKAAIDALNAAEAAGAQHTRARAINDPDPETFAIYKQLKAEYDSLGKAGQDAYNQMLGVFENMHNETAVAVKDRIKAMLPDTADVDNAQTRNIILRGIYNKIFAEKGLMVYQPLQRSGEFKLTYNGIHPTTNTTENFVHAFDTAAQRDRAVDLLRALPKEFNISDIDTPLQKISDPFGARRSPPAAFITDVTRLITKGALQDAATAKKRILSQGGTEADAEIEYKRVLADVKNRAEANNRAIVELALDAMPESSIFNAYRARKNVSGFVGDLSPLRTAFEAIEGDFDSVDTSSELLDTKLSSMVRQVSAIRHQAESAKIMTGLTAQLESIRLTRPADEAGAARIYYDALATSLQNPTIRRSQFAANMNTGVFVWTLFGNVSSAVVNTMGVMLVIYPRLAARYGAVNAAKIMLRSLRDIANSGRSRMEYVIGADGKPTMQPVDTGAVGRSVRNYTFGGVDFSQGYNTGSNDTNVLKYLVDQGMRRHMFVDSSIYDYLESNKSGLGAFADKMLHLGAAPMHHTERIIRESTMIANYRLELKAMAKRKGTAVLTESDMQAAAKFAIEQTELMNSTTPSTAAPNWAQKGIMPMIAMYKRYPLAMMHLLLGDIRMALPGKAKLEAIHGVGTEAFFNALESRKIARLQVAGQLGSMALFAGAMGMPLYGLFADVFDALFTEDDEEKFDILVRRNLGELGAKGILNYLLGVDISSRIGMSDIFYRAPLRADDQKFYQNIIEGAMGPAAGLVFNTLPRAIELYDQGEYYRALEAATPAAARNALRAYRFATTGAAESLRGDVISDMDPGSVLAQALGFAPAAYIRQMELSSAAKKIETAIKEKKTKLLRQLNLARRNRDSVGIRDALADINEFRRKHPGMITKETIADSRDTFERTTTRVRNGVVYADLNLPDIRPAFELMDEPVTIWD
jgi:hypothetical protein